MSRLAGLEHELAAIAGRRWVASNAAARAAYAYDSGTIAAAPELIVLPANSAEVRRILLACHRHGVPVTPRGAGSCLSGGPVAVHGGVVLGLTRLNRILTLDPLNQVAIVEPGVVNAQLGRAAARHGLGFMPDPASMEVSTVGGNAAENAGGPRAVRYGVFGRHVVGLEYMLGDGTVLTAGRLAAIPCADLARPSLELGPVLIGSEGTLAVITRLALRLTPLPAATSTTLALFAAAEHAGRAVAALTVAGLALTAVELMGRLDIRLADEFLGLGIPPETGALLLLEISGPAPGLDRQIRLACAIAAEHGASMIESATSAAERERLWRARRASSGLYGRVRPSYVSGDITVPLGQMPAVFRRIEELELSHGQPIGLIGHAGDGNLHPAVLFDPADPREAQAAHEVNGELVREALRLGGSVSGEHGIGLEKLGFMAEAFGRATLRYFRGIKRAFDPPNRLNPGKVLPAEAAVQTGDVTQPATRGGACADATLVASLGDLIARGDVILLRDDQKLARYGLGGARRPVALALPRDTAGLAAVVRHAGAAGVSVWPIGSGSLLHCGTRPFEGGLAVSTARMRRVLEASPAEMICRLEAGATAADLDAAIRGALPSPEQRRPWYPVDPWRGIATTVGAEVATNAVGPGRPGYGSTRDRLLGVTFVDARGEVCRAGGRTIKNVAGYDAAGLLCGSWGTLGFITEVTLRLEPPPERRSTVRLSAPRPADLAPVAHELRRTAGLWALELVAPAGGRAEWVLLAGLAGQREDLAATEPHVLRMAAGAGLAAQVLSAAAAATAWHAVRAARGPALCRAWSRGCAPRPWLAGYALVPPSGLAAAAAALFARLGARLTACWPCGSIDFGLRGPARLRDVGLAVAEALAAAGGGESGFYGMSDDLAAETALSTPARPDDGVLLTRLKAEIDPAGLFAPGSLTLPQ